MKTIKVLAILVAGSLWFSSCTKKEESVSTPDFDVTANTTNIHVGDTLRFSLTGNPDIITFYSGLSGADYSFKEKDRVYSATATLSFKAAKYAGNNEDCAALKYSTDFNGVYDLAAVRKATWIDISDRFYIPHINGSSPIMEDAGEKDISDLFTDKKPIYFCWFFTTKANSSRTRFQINSFQVNGIVADDPELSGPKYDFAACAFKMIQGEGFLTEGSDTYIPRVTATAIIWDGIFASTVLKEGWAVSAPISPVSDLNLGHDLGTCIKSASDSRLHDYQFVYAQPGTYTVAFAAANANVSSKKQVVKQIKITVTP